MKLVFLKLLFLGSFGFVINAQNALAGSHAGNGTSQLGDYALSPWFKSGDKNAPIQTCIEIAPGFELTKNQVMDALNETISHWHEHLKRVPQREFSDNFVFGPCSPIIDLKIKFGTEDKEDKEATAGMLNSLGASHRKSVKKLPGNWNNWSKGFIWISKQGRYPKPTLTWTSKSKSSVFPEWNDAGQTNLKNVLLHEFGHLFIGDQHINGTIMSPGVVYMDVLYEQSMIHNRINISDEVFPCAVDCSYQNLGTGNPEDAKEFNRVSGRGKNSEMLVPTEFSWSGAIGNENQTYTLSAESKSGRVETFLIQTKPELLYPRDALRAIGNPYYCEIPSYPVATSGTGLVLYSFGDLSKAPAIFKPCQRVDGLRGQQGMIFNGVLIGKDKSRNPVLIFKNMSGRLARALDIKVLSKDGYTYTPIFQSKNLGPN